jgi:two-component system cell cycle response regulator DivK
MVSSGLKKRLLLLDKNGRMVSFADEITFYGDFDVCTINTPEEVFNQAKIIKPDLILLLGDDGLEVCNYLKEDDNLKDIPVIVVTSDRFKKEVSHTYKCDALFVKPIGMNILATRIFFNSIVNYIIYLMKKINNIEKKRVFS